jgi:penicillin-binding protein 1C
MRVPLRRRVWLLAPVLVAVAGWLLLPEPELYPRNGFSTAVYDRAGRLLQLSLAPDERYRVRLEPERIAPVLVEAVRLYEDRHFFMHPGVNPAALVRAGWSTYVSGERVVGGSTLTMQLARLSFRLETRSIGGKLLQIFRALQLERHYGKRELLAAYLNLAPYGGNIEGVGAASLIYFGKPAAELSLPEALALAVIPQNPAARNPLTTSGNALFEARARLFEIWLDAHPEAQAAAPLLKLPLHFGAPAQLQRAAPHFARDVSQRHPRGGEIMTTLDSPLQRRVETLVDHYRAQRGPDGIRNAAVLVLDHRNNDVLVEVGSADFSESAIAGQVNGARAKRSPGSALKPFIYGLALDQGHIHPMTLLKDAPRRYGLYTPENFDRDFEGPVTARDALVYSRNVPAVELLANLRQPDFHDLLTRAAVRDLKPREHYGLALALGGNEVTMHELAGLYAALANGGLWRPLREKAADAPGAPPARLLSEEAAFLLLDMLAQTPRPDALPLPTARNRLRVAWKTGTSFAFRDAWSVGVVGQYVVAVWVGNFDGSGNPAFVGIRGAAPLFFSIADQLSEQPGFKPLPELPDAHLNLAEVAVCEPTGDLPGRHCPRTALSWFIPGVSPIKVSDVHRAVRIDTVSGLRACWSDANVITEIYAVWPSDIASVFRQAGISFPAPPRWHDRCPLARRNSQAVAPTILSPDSNISYALRAERAESETIPFQAVSDGEARKLFWFVDDRFVGHARPRETFFWSAEPGKFTVRVVDDLGQAATSEMTVGLAQ